MMGAPQFRKAALLAGFVAPIVFLATSGSASADPVPPTFVRYPNPPSSVDQANHDLAMRKSAIVEFMACGNEANFLDFLFNKPPVAGEGIGPMLVGKMQWLRAFEMTDQAVLNRNVCKNEAVLAQDSISAIFRLTDPNLSHAFDPSGVNRQLFDITNGQCRSIIKSIRPIGDKAVFDFEISARCMRAEVNVMASRLLANVAFDDDKKVLGPAQVGTDGLPCFSGAIGDVLIPPIIPHPAPSISVKGDADVGIRDMTRVFYLDDALDQNGVPTGKSRNIFDPATRAYVRDKLLTLHGKTGPDGYSILDCGNTEQSDGTPQDLLDEHDFLEETKDDIGDALGWFAKRFAVLALLLAPPAQLAAGILSMLGENSAGAAAASVVTSLGSIAVASAVVDPKIPETENHRLMIESSRYLKNQIIIDEQPNHPNIGSLKDEQNEVKEWLMAYMSAIMRKDFSEYNARPYQRYSQIALLNLADFAEDAKIRAAARMVLEYTMAKFALGSRDGIRVLPYRRRIDAMNKNLNMVEFGGEATDFSIAMMQYYAGLSHHLTTIDKDVAVDPDAEGHTVTTEKGLPYGNATVMVYAASSSFMPGDAILDLAIDKSATYFQRVHHDGVEIYSNMPGATVSAGGLAEPPGHQLLLGPIDTGVGAKFSDDQGGPGVGVPTSVIFEGAPQVDRLGMLGFEGKIDDVGHVCKAGESGDDCKNGVGFGTAGRIYDENACVWFGFACGFNYKDAAADPALNIASCFVPGLDNAPLQWSFLNSAKCGGLAGGDKTVFVARFLLDCNGDDDCASGRKFGFIEVVDASTNSDDAHFDAFRRKVVASNASVFPHNDTSSDAIGKEGTYHTSSGTVLKFKIADGDSRVTEIFGGIKQPDISDWRFLDGDVLNSEGDGIVTFKNPRTNQFITWDFSDVDNPRHLSQP
jgi:hypothetical protein